MQCSKCQTPHAAGVAICDHCGADLLGTPGAKRATSLESSAGSPFGAAAASPSSPPSPGVYRPPSDAKRRTMIETGPGQGAAGGGVFDPFAAAVRPGGDPAPRPFAGGDPFGAAMGRPGEGASGSGGAAPKRRTQIDLGDAHPELLAAQATVTPAARPTLERRVVGWAVSYDPDPNGLVLIIKEGRNAIGRAADNDLVVDDPRMSSRHATIQHRSGRTWVYDENSNNGTFLNGEDIFQERPSIADGDVIKLGGTRFLIKLLDLARVAEVFQSKVS